MQQIWASSLQLLHVHPAMHMQAAWRTPVCNLLFTNGNARIDSYVPSAGGAALVDGLEDASADHLWQWELRDQKVRPALLPRLLSCLCSCPLAARP